MDGKIDKHFEQVDKVTDYVADAAKGVAQAIDSVTKGLTDALLAAVGLVVVTLLAALVKEPANQIVIKMALSAYALYLLLFQGVYRMGSIAHSYLLLREETEQRLATYVERLGREKVCAPSSSLEKRKRQFWTWFLVTGVIYVAIALLFWHLGGNLFSYLTQWGVVSPTAMPTPTVAPTGVPTP